MTPDTFEILPIQSMAILSHQPRPQTRTEIPITSDYLAVRGWGETWNAMQKIKFPERYPARIPYAERLIREVSQMLDQ